MIDLRSAPITTCTATATGAASGGRSPPGAAVAAVTGRPDDRQPATTADPVMSATAPGARHTTVTTGPRGPGVAAVTALTAGLDRRISVAARTAIPGPSGVTALATRSARPVGAVSAQDEQQLADAGVAAVATITGVPAVSARAAGGAIVTRIDPIRTVGAVPAPAAGSTVTAARPSRRRKTSLVGNANLPTRGEGRCRGIRFMGP